MVGLALEGGGAKGSYQAGAYMALKKCGIKVHAVAGTSIGSLNGALIASHDENKMLSLWRDATMTELLGIDENKAHEILKSGLSIDKIKISFTELYKAFKNKGLDMSNYRALVRNAVDENKLRKSDIIFGLTTIKLANMTPLELYLDDIPEGKLHDYIVASSYLPVFKKEKLIDDGYYLDGGFYNLSPSDMLEKVGCDTIYVINIKGVGFRKPKFKTKAKIIEIKPSTNLGSIIFFDKTSTEENIKRGYNDTMRVLGHLDGENYYFKRRANLFYKLINRKVSDKLYKAVSALLRSTSEKETVVKALEHILKKESCDDLQKYRIKDVIKMAKKNKTEDIIYTYVRSLRIW